MLKSELQKRVFALLLEKVGAGPACFYLDSCTLQHLSDHFLSARLLVAHALREMRGGVEERIASVLPNEVSGGTPALDELRRALHKLAHRSALQLPVPIDAAFRQQIEGIDELLARTLETLPLPRATSDAEAFLQRFRDVDQDAPAFSPDEGDVRVLRQFLDRVAPGPAAYYADVLRLLDPRFAALTTRSHLAAHALREAESGLRAVLLPYDFTPADPQTSIHRQQVHAILDAYGIARTEETAQAWESITDFATDQNLARRAHRSGLGLPAPCDAAAIGFYHSIINVFGAMLRRFEYEFAKYLHKLDELLVAKNITKGMRQAFLQTVPQTEPIYDYFFRNLQHPGWIAVLADTEVLTRTPEPWREGDTTILPAWPQGDYLRRMLELRPSLSTAVAPLVMSAATSHNPRVHELSLRIAALLPEADCIAAAERETAWLEQQAFIPFLPTEAVGTLATALAGYGRSEVTTALLRTVIHFDVEIVDGRSEIRFRSDRLALEQLLTDVVPALAVACGFPILDVVSDALQTIRNAQHPGLRPPADYSYLWRPAIADSEENDRGDMRDALINALRDGAAAMAGAGADERRKVISWLANRTWNIERRIALYLASISADTQLASILASRTDFWTFNDIRPELTQLLHAHWEQFSAEAREAVAHASGKGEEFSPPLEPEPVPVPRAGFVSSLTPLHRAQLERMEVEEIIEYLRAWKPRPIDYSTLSMDSPGALAGELRAVVAMRPEEYAAAAGALEGLAPVYMDGVVGGLADAVQNGARFELTPALALLASILRQPRSVNDHRLMSDEPYEGSWVQVHLTVLDLLENALRRRVLPVASCPVVTALLVQLLRDPHPSPDDDADYPGGAERWLANSIGSVRGKAVGGFVLLAQVFPAEAAVIQALESAVDERLDSRVESSPSVRFAIGLHFVRLLRVVPEWTRSRVATIFERSSELRQAAWAGYLHNGISDESGRLLRHKYEEAIDALDPAQQPSGTDKLLAQHLTMLFAHGEVTTAPDDLLSKFFSVASAALRYHALGCVSRDVRAPNTSGGIIEKYMQLWVWREKYDDHAELAAFDDWVLSDRFPYEWSVDQLTELAGRGVRFFRYMTLIEHLNERWESDPRRAVMAVRALTESEPDAIHITAARKDLRLLIERGTSHEDAFVRGETRRLANIAAARGLTDLKVFV